VRASSSSFPSLAELDNPSILSGFRSLCAAHPDGKYLSGQKGNPHAYRLQGLSPEYHQRAGSARRRNLLRAFRLDCKALIRAILKFGPDRGGRHIPSSLPFICLKTKKTPVGSGPVILLHRSIHKLKEWIIAIRLERTLRTGDPGPLANRSLFRGIIYMSSAAPPGPFFRKTGETQRGRSGRL